MKKDISAADMKALLIREFHLLRSKDCKTCEPPVPYWGPAPNSGAGYWYLDMPAMCPHGCRQVISTLWADITSSYDIASPPPGDNRRTPPQRNPPS